MRFKRLFDFVIAGIGFLIISPVLLIVGAAIFLYDFRTPLYIAERVGKDGTLFRMIKLRSMVIDADQTNVTSTSATDSRITPVGRFVRRFKLDELVQLWNVVRGDMSLVGPRPNVPSGVALYTPLERRLLQVRPGMTDFASIVFADEGEILDGHQDPDKAYDQLIRPWKSRLGLFYLEKRSAWLDLQLVGSTILAIASRNTALRVIHHLLISRDAPSELAQIALRRNALVPQLPPGSNAVNAAPN